ncbi:hypothetical protein [Nonomuraea sp. NPDC050540]|uniref:hypothetical protein n=1 Tax=Nonomuraea sp. NPDC050540 TaxID=3364367 RepID=UPI0037A805D5
MSDERRTQFGLTLTAIQRHRQGHHGWSALHRAFGRLLSAGDPAFCRLLDTAWAARPGISDAHLITLLSAAVRGVCLRDGGTEAWSGLEELRDLVERNEAALARDICGRSNSFTGARRFLAPQLIIGGHAAQHGLDEVRLLDLGTGVGILPRQLNNRTVYDRFAKDLSWEPWTPAYWTIPLTARCGVDAYPLPTLEWVYACHGPSSYYKDRFEELMWSFEQTADVAEDVVIRELDILDLPRLAAFIREHTFNVITCNFVLFQYGRQFQKAVEDCVMSSIAEPGLFLTMNPSQALLSPGCRIRGRLAGGRTELRLADASDAHLLGTITVGPDLTTIIGEGRENSGG